MIQLKRLPIGELKPAPYNPRIALKPGMPEYERLKRSLEEFGLVEPLVWNERTGHVVGGNQRLEILRQQGAEPHPQPHEIDVAVVSLSLEREKALNVALNNARLAGDWDPEALAGVLSDLQELPDFDVTLTGFDERDLRDLLLVPDPDPPEEKSEPEAEDKVRVVLEIPLDTWEQIRPEIDRLMGEWKLAAHIRLPEGA